MLLTITKPHIDLVVCMGQNYIEIKNKVIIDNHMSSSSERQNIHASGFLSQPEDTVDGPECEVVVGPECEVVVGPDSDDEETELCDSDEEETELCDSDDEESE